MWGPLRIGVALLAFGAGHDVLPPLSHNSGMTLVVRLPDGKRVSKVQLLVAGGTPQAQTAKGVMTLTTPPVRDHEVIAIDFA